MAGEGSMNNKRDSLMPKGAYPGIGQVGCCMGGTPSIIFNLKQYKTQEYDNGRWK